MDQAEPDLAAVRQSLLAGLNHPDDINGMIRLLRNFRNVSVMNEVIATWTKGDEHISELNTVAIRLHLAIRAGSYTRT